MSSLLEHSPSPLIKIAQTMCSSHQMKVFLRKYTCKGSNSQEFVLLQSGQEWQQQQCWQTRQGGMFIPAGMFKCCAFATCKILLHYE